MTKNAVAIVNDENVMRDIQSFDDAVKALTDAGVAIVDMADEGDGFSLAEKSTLVGVPFIIVGMRIHEKGTFGEFVIIHLVTEDGRKLIINDGSTGVKNQCQGMLDRGVQSVLVRNGLTRSDYEYTDEKGNVIPATTYYLSS